MAEPPLLVLTTVGSRADALALAHALVVQRLVACAQIGEITSVYRWDGTVQEEPEWRLLLKTTAASYAPLEAAIRAQHPYELPAIVALPATQALAPFAEWVASNVGGDGA